MSGTDKLFVGKLKQVKGIELREVQLKIGWSGKILVLSV